MSWVSKLISKLTPAPKRLPNKEAFFESFGQNRRPIATYSYNGEKNLGDAGPIINYRLEFSELRYRSWQAMLESDTAQIAVNRLITWIIGKGLKPQSEPAVTVLENEGIKLTTEQKRKFAKDVEAGFNLYRRSKRADYSGMKNLNEISEEGEKNATVGGDVLVILRYIDKTVKVQLIDAQHLESPLYGTEWYPRELPNGHRLIDGVEVDQKGQHIAYYIRTYYVTGDMQDLFQYKFERVEARGKKSGMLMAYLHYASKLRINNTRGIPLISSVIEKLQQLQQYTASALKQAKLSSDVSYQVVHHKDAEGKAPFANNIVQGFDADRGKNLPVTDDGVQLAKNIQVTTGNSSFNNPPGAEIKVLENKNPLYYKEFFETNSDSVFAVLSIPPNVAMSKYNDSFSASRAAIKDWEHTLLVKREHHCNGFLQPIYDLWLYTQILEGKIQAPGYITALAENNLTVIEAYHNVRFVGSNVPHIDPVKEVTAARLKLGTAGAHLPFSDLERETESLGGGESTENLEQFSEELELAEGFKIVPLPIVQSTEDSNTKNKKEDEDD